MYKIFITLIFIPFVIFSNSCNNNIVEKDDENINSDLTTKIMDTTFVSEYVNDSIKVDVSLPSHYYENPDKIYKVVYMTDGYWR